MNQTPQRVYHVSDQPAIAVFEPRPSRAADARPLVWAVNSARLPNYMLPRDCPRVTFHARDDSSPEDIHRLLGGTGAKCVIAVETAWLPRIREETLYLYEFDGASFELNDEVAGYYVSDEAVVPLSERKITDVLGELLSCDVELRIMPSLWKLRECVIHSSLGFSLIRMRNAQPPAEGTKAYFPLP